MTKRVKSTGEAGRTVGNSVPDISQEAFSEAVQEVEEVLVQAEKAFRDLGLGTSAQVLICHESIDTGPNCAPASEVVMLTFGRRQGRWKLYVESGIDTAPETWCSEPLESQNLEVKAAAVQELPILYSKLKSARFEKIAELKETAKFGREFLGTLSGGRDD